LHILGLCAVGILAWATASGPAPQQGPLPLEEFWTRLQSTLAVVEALNPEDSAAVRAALDQEAAAWKDVTAIQLDDGSVVPVDTGGLVADLSEDPPDLKVIKARLEALIKGRENWPPAAMDGQDGENAALELKKILAAEEFQWPEASTAKSPIQEFIDQTMDRFWTWLFNLLPESVTADLSCLRMMIALPALLMLVLILIYAARRISGGLVAEDALDLEGEDGIEVVTADSAFKRAKDTAESGDYRSAVRWLYLSSLLTLEERGLLHYDRTRTNREYLRSVGKSPELASSLRDIVDVFDRVWYGFQPIDAPTFNEYVKHVTELRRVR
jgi:hypothetical protein